MGRWEYVGGKERVRRGNDMRYMKEEANVSRWRRYDPRLNRGKWKLEESNRYYERRQSERDMRRGVRRKDAYQRRNSGGDCIT